MSIRPPMQSYTMNEQNRRVRLFGVEGTDGEKKTLYDLGI